MSESHVKLKRIPMRSYDGCLYKDVYDVNYSFCMELFDEGLPPIDCVKTHVYQASHLFDECGMDKLVMLIAGLTFEIDHDGAEDEVAYNTWLAIKDFNTGDYDDLFTPEDLKLIKADVERLCDWFDEHPEFTEGEPIYNDTALETWAHIKKEVDVTLKHIPLEYYNEFTYTDVYGAYYDNYLEYLNRGYTMIQCVKGIIYHGADVSFEECGMERLVMLIAGLTFEIDHDGAEEEVAYNTWLAIKDFNTGYYDDLFTPKDLKLIKADVKRLCNWFDEHPEFTEGEPIYNDTALETWAHIKKEVDITLKRIPIHDYDECPYTDTYTSYYNIYCRYFGHGSTPLQCVKTYVYQDADTFDECGMEKLVMLIAGLMFEIDHDGAEDEVAYNTWLAIQDFNTGNYDDLFTPEDLKLIKADVKRLCDWFDKHPEFAGD